MTVKRLNIFSIIIDIDLQKRDKKVLLVVKMMVIFAAAFRLGECYKVRELSSLK